MRDDYCDYVGEIWQCESLCRSHKIFIANICTFSKKKKKTT